MKKSLVLAALTLAAIAPVAHAAETTQNVEAATESAGVDVKAGKVIYGSNGYRIGAVQRVTSAGDPQVIVNSRLVIVPASTLSTVDGKLQTSLSKRELGRLK